MQLGLTILLVMETSVLSFSCNERKWIYDMDKYSEKFHHLTQGFYKENNKCQDYYQMEYEELNDFLNGM